MDMNLFCVMCGNRLQSLEGKTECCGCGAVYGDLVLSESRVERDGFEVTEMSFCGDITLKMAKPSIPAVEVPQIETASALGVEELEV